MENSMSRHSAAQTPVLTERQKKITKRVMHEFKQGELESGLNGSGGKVKSRKQAIAIALSESGLTKKHVRA
jgi:hypothetical protein